MAEDNEEMRSLYFTPTWSVATVLTVFIAVSLLLERAIHHLSSVSKNLLLASSCALSLCEEHQTFSCNEPLLLHFLRFSEFNVIDP